MTTFRQRVCAAAASRLPSDTLAAPRSEATNALRRRIKTELEDQIMDFFAVQGGQVVIYDANNGSVAERKITSEKFGAKGVHVIYLGQSPGQQSVFRISILITAQRVSVTKKISLPPISAVSSSPLPTCVLLPVSHVAR